MHRTDFHDEPGRLPAALVLVVMLAAATLAAPRTTAQDGAGERLDGTRTALEQWVETRRVISKERRDWALGKEVLADRIDLVQREITSLREKITEARGSITDADVALADLVEQNAGLEAASASLDEVVLALEERCRSLLARLPDPIVDRLGPLRQRLPKPDAEEVKLSMSERFLTITGILTEVTKFHREVTVASEERELSDGRSAVVDTVYIGIGYGFYCTATADAAGIGTATADGWTWAPADEHAAAIARVVKILNNEDVAGFVPLPVDLR